MHYNHKDKIMPDPILISVLVTSAATLLTQIFQSIRSNQFSSSCGKDGKGGSCMEIETEQKFAGAAVTALTELAPPAPRAPLEIPIPTPTPSIKDGQVPAPIPTSKSKP